jgi:hypothetical protein
VVTQGRAGLEDRCELLLGRGSLLGPSFGGFVDRRERVLVGDPLAVRPVEDRRRLGEAVGRDLGLPFERIDGRQVIDVTTAKVLDEEGRALLGGAGRGQLVAALVVGQVGGDECLDRHPLAAAFECLLLGALGGFFG